jgi:hypothetical protein
MNKEVSKYTQEFDEVVKKNLKSFLQNPDLDKFKQTHLDLAEAAAAVYIHTLVNGLAMHGKEEAEKILKKFENLHDLLLDHAVKRSNTLVTNVNDFIKNAL